MPKADRKGGAKREGKSNKKNGRVRLSRAEADFDQ
jgi:hypothetical protein